MAKIDDEIKSKFPNNRTKAVINVLYTSAWLSNKQNTFLKPYDISPQQYNILRILRGAKGELLTVHSIKERMLDKAPNVTRLVDKLLDKELTSRIRCEHDRRVVWIGITQKGLALLTSLDPLIKDFDSKGKLTEDEAQVLSDLLDKLREE